MANAKPVNPEKPKAGPVAAKNPDGTVQANHANEKPKLPPCATKGITREDN